MDIRNLEVGGTQLRSAFVAEPGRFAGISAGVPGSSHRIARSQPGLNRQASSSRAMANATTPSLNLNQRRVTRG